MHQLQIHHGSVIGPKISQAPQRTSFIRPGQRQNVYRPTVIVIDKANNYGIL